MRIGGGGVRPAIFVFVPASQDSRISPSDDIIDIKIIFTKELNSGNRKLRASMATVSIDELNVSQLTPAAQCRSDDEYR